MPLWCVPIAIQNMQSDPWPSQTECLLLRRPDSRKLNFVRVGVIEVSLDPEVKSIIPPELHRVVEFSHGDSAYREKRMTTFKIY
jgi:hypothetical protein